MGADQVTALLAEMSEDAKTIVIGGDWAARRMMESIMGRQADVAEL